MTNTADQTDQTDQTDLTTVSDPAGFSTYVANIGIKDDSVDFAVVVADVAASVAAVYTMSRFAGPSVKISRDVTANGQARGIVTISKNANVANGPAGLVDAIELRSLVAQRVGVDPNDLVVASTGVIGRPYPMDRVRAGVDAIEWPSAVCDFDAVAEAIMTTDTYPKVSRHRAGAATIVGIAKGVGMIEPDMATLLTYFFTDADIDAVDLDAMFRRVVDQTFNALSIDTDTSTSDTAVVMANGVAGAVDHRAFETALHDVALDLVLMIAADGEGASKVILVTVTGARNTGQARRVAKSIVNSPLVKTAVHGADPNWGRVVMAIGKTSDADDIDPDRVTVWIGDIEMYPTPADPAALAEASGHMEGDRVTIRAELGIGAGEFTAYGCDLTDGYVRINADYTT